MRWEYCARSWASIALRLPRMGYSLHGHDVEVEACIESSRVVDVEEVARSLGEAVSSVDYKPIWEALGRDEALIEDLLLHVLDKLQARGYKVTIIKATLPRGRVIKLKPGNQPATTRGR